MRTEDYQIHLSHWPFSGSILVWDGISCFCSQIAWTGLVSYYPLVICYIAIENGHLYWIFPLKMVIFHSFLYVYQGYCQWSPMSVPRIWGFLQNTLQFSFWEYLSNMRIEPKHHVSWDTQPGIPGCLGLGLKSSILETSSQIIFQF